MADIVGLLIAERDRIDRAIAILQGTEPRRGRPAGRRGPGRPAGRPKKVAKRGGRGMSPAARKATSERMKKYWAKRRRAAKGK